MPKFNDTKRIFNLLPGETKSMQAAITPRQTISFDHNLARVKQPDPQDTSQQDESEQVTRRPRVFQQSNCIQRKEDDTEHTVSFRNNQFDQSDNLSVFSK